jgi:hypothetical protein
VNLVLSFLPGSGFLDLVVGSFCSLFEWADGIRVEWAGGIRVGGAGGIRTGVVVLPPADACSLVVKAGDIRVLEYCELVLS